MLPKGMRTLALPCSVAVLGTLVTVGFWIGLDGEPPPWPKLMLAGGIAVSLLLAGLVHQLRSAEGTVRDLDELNRELERRVEERTAELREAVTELEGFNYSVSHDLRSPLGAILTFTALLEEDFGEELPPEARAMLDRIRSSADTSMALLEGLLELSRASSADLRPARTDVAELAQELWGEIASGREPAAQLELRELPEAWADPALLRHALAHLLGNALKFTGPRELPRIALEGERSDGESIFRIEDNGVGFDMRFADKLFQPFERLHSEKEFRGTGVGLAIVRRIVSRHGGRVWAEAEEGQGARFCFALPAAPREPA